MLLNTFPDKDKILKSVQTFPESMDSVKQCLDGPHSFQPTTGGRIGSLQAEAKLDAGPLPT